MQQYDFSMNHKLGSQMTKADLLSRQTGHLDGKDDNKGVTLLLEQWFWSTVTQVDGSVKRIIEQARKGSEKRDKVVTKSLALKEDEWEETDLEPDGLYVTRHILHLNLK